MSVSEARIGTGKSRIDPECLLEQRLNAFLGAGRKHVGEAVALKNRS